MRLYSALLFLTLVVTTVSSQAAPVIDHKPPTIDLSPKDPQERIWASRATADYDWSARVSFLGGALTETAQSAQHTMYGLRGDFMKRPLSTWQMEVMVASDNFVHLTLGQKFHFALETVTLPYYRLALGDLIDSGEGIGSVFNFKKFQIIAAAGLDDLFLLNQRLQVEVSVAGAIIGPQFEMSLGLAF